jgi:hypothetical protein
MDTKDLVIFFPWEKQDIAKFREVRETSQNKHAREKLLLSIANSVIMTNVMLSTMNFDDNLEVNTFVSDYLSEEDWNSIKNSHTVLGETEPRNPNWQTAKIFEMHCMRSDSCRGWLIDLKKLIFYRLNEYTLEFCKGKMKTMKTFDELEKFKEDFNFRFASKKFGL